MYKHTVGGLQRRVSWDTIRRERRIPRARTYFQFACFFIPNCIFRQILHLKGFPTLASNRSEGTLAALCSSSGMLETKESSDAVDAAYSISAATDVPMHESWNSD